MKRILAATDGSEHGACAVVTGADLARRAGASLHVVSVVETVLPTLYGAGVFESEVGDALLLRARRAAEVQARQAKAADPHFHVVAGLPAPFITRLASETAADVVVVGAHPRPEVKRLLVGSTAESVIRLAHCPVLAATARRRAPFRRVLAAVDLSPHARSVMHLAGVIVKVDGADLRILHVNEPFPPMLIEAAQFGADDLLKVGHEAFERLIEETRGLPESEHCERNGYAGHEILVEAREWEADLLIVGSQGLGFFNRTILGSTSMYLLRHGRVATIVVPDKHGHSQTVHREVQDAA
ncbi:MAG: universal stress protein [Gemmatimonadales bacterium]|nr:universal stress protein [Gemmatimonadales bacterium]